MHPWFCDTVTSPNTKCILYLLLHTLKIKQKLITTCIHVYIGATRNFLRCYFFLCTIIDRNIERKNTLLVVVTNLRIYQVAINGRYLAILQCIVIKRRVAYFFHLAQVIPVHNFVRQVYWKGLQHLTICSIVTRA